MWCNAFRLAFLASCTLYAIWKEWNGLLNNYVAKKKFNLEGLHEPQSIRSVQHPNMSLYYIMEKCIALGVSMPNIDSMCYLILLLCTANVLLFSFTLLMTNYARTCVSNTLTHSNVSVYFVLLHCLFCCTYVMCMCIVPLMGCTKWVWWLASAAFASYVENTVQFHSWLMNEYLCSDNILPLVLASAKQIRSSVTECISAL